MSAPTAFGRDGRYRTVRELGQGGMGAVYLAEDTVLRRLVAVKVMSGLLQGSRQAATRFRREARTLAALRHPNLVQVYDLDLDARPPCMVMEYLEGRDLEALIEARELLAPGAARALLRSLADALACLHGNRILHRDLKPSNILLGADGRPRLMDFGLTVEMDTTRVTGSGQVLGTPLYMPPEVLFGGEHRPASDVYQLGMVLHVAMTGTHPYQAAPSLPALMTAIDAGLHERQGPAASLPEDLRRIVAACWAANPAARPPDGRALVELLRREFDADLAPPSAPSAPQRVVAAPAPRAPSAASPRPSTARPARLAVALATLGALLAATLSFRSAPGGDAAPTATPPLAAVARELAFLPDGVHVVLAPRAAAAPRWRLEAPGGAGAQGTFVRTAGGWSLDLHDLAPGARGTLSLFDGDRLVAAEPVDLPTSAFLMEPRAGLGTEALSLTFELHGRATVTARALDERGSLLARAATSGTRLELPVPTDAAKATVAWRLDLAGRALARGTCSAALTLRFQPPRRPDAAHGGDSSYLEGPLAVVGDLTCLWLPGGVLQAVAPSPTASGAVFRSAGRELAGGSARRGVLALLPCSSPVEVLVVHKLDDGTAVRRLAFSVGQDPKVLAERRFAEFSRRVRGCRLPSARCLLVAQVSAEASLREPKVRADLVDAATCRALSSLDLPGTDVLEVCPLGATALVATHEGGDVRLRLVEADPSGTLRCAWVAARVAHGPEGRDGGPACPTAALTDGRTAVVAVGRELLVVERTAEPPGALLRSLPLPVADDAVPCAVMARAGRSVLLGFVERFHAALRAGAIAVFLCVDLEAGSVVQARLPHPVIRPFDLCRRWGLLRRGGLLFAPVGQQLFVLRDGPRPSLVQELVCPVAMDFAPVVVGDTLLVATVDGDLYGRELPPE